MEEKRQFPLFTSHLDLAHQKWAQIAQKGFWAIDATCGNGHDTAYLAGLFSGVVALDIQQVAIDHTKSRCEGLNSVHFFLQSHETFPQMAHDNPIMLIVYNLGYLPGGKKSETTLTSTTMQSVASGLKLLQPGGLMSITCYPGHGEGAKEEIALLQYAKNLDPRLWSVCHHRFVNRLKSPSLLLLQKSNHI